MARAAPAHSIEVSAAEAHVRQILSQRSAITVSRFARLPKIVPPAESSDLDELYAFLGAALFVAQGLELEVTNLIVGVQGAASPSLLPGATTAMFEELEGKTFGGLLADVRRHAAVDTETEALLRRALKERNRLVHDFFSGHDENVYSEAGRREMIEDLRSIIALFCDADEATNQITTRVWKELGLTEEMIRERWQELAARAAARDGTA